MSIESIFMKIFLVLLFAFSYSFSTASLLDVKTTANNLNVRNGPHSQAHKVRALSKGRVVHVYSEANGWYRIGKNEWIFAKYTEKVEKTPTVVAPVKQQKYEKYENNEKYNEVATEKEVSQKLNKGYISDTIQVDLLYGYQLMTLDVTTDIEHIDSVDSNGNALQLANGGTYTFDSISLEYKKINISFRNFTLSYENTSSSQKVDDTSNLADDVALKIQEIIGGYLPLEVPNNWLNHTAKVQLITRKAEFDGSYEVDGNQSSFSMNKNRYSLKGTHDFDARGLMYFYGRLDYENSTFPMIIYAADGDVNFLDENFNAAKYNLVAGVDTFIDNGFFYGYRFGFGLSYTELSAQAASEVASTGISLGSPLSYNLQVALKAGYSRAFVFKYTVFELGVLYDLEYFKELSNDVDSGNGNITLVYDRAEIMSTLKINARLSF